MIKDYSAVDSFVIHMCVSGKAAIEVNGYSEMIEQGQTILVPAKSQAVDITAAYIE